MRSPEQALLGEPGDDTGSVDLEISPIDGDEPLEQPSLSPSYARSPYAMSQPTVDHGKLGAHSRGSGHQVSLEPPFRSNSQHESRLPFSGSGQSERMAPSTIGSNPSSRMSIGHDGLNFSYPGAQSSSLFGTESVTPHQGWPPRGDRIQPAWLGNTESRSVNGQKHNSYPLPSSANPWSNSSSQHPQNTIATSSSTFFPTLNTPFFPGQSPFQSNIPASPSISSHPSSYDQISQMQHPSMSRDFTPRGYGSPSSLPSYPSSTRDPLLSNYGQRNLPPVQTMTGYAHSQSPASSSSGSGHAPAAFWGRE